MVFRRNVGLNFACLPYIAKDATITGLMQKYLDQSPELSAHQFPTPTASDIALYLHTSSASSVANVKCVPLTHEGIISGAKSRLAYWQRTWPQQEFANLRVLGWSPWSHIIGLSSDLGASMLLSAGTYIFAMVPSSYDSANGDSSKSSRYLDVCGQLLETAMLKKPTAFAGVPWVLEGFMRTHKEEIDSARKQRIQDAIRMLKVFGSGGAATNPECIQWAIEQKLPLVFDIGMTELGGMYLFRDLFLCPQLTYIQGPCSTQPSTVLRDGPSKTVSSLMLVFILLMRWVPSPRLVSHFAS